MKLRTVPAGQFAWNDGIYAAFACDLDGINYSNCRRITSDTPASEYADKTILVFTIEEMAQSSFYNGYTYADTMNREATDYFLQLTHEQYKARCGDRLGSSIRGIFTDEPHRGAVMCGFGMSNAGRHVDDALDRQAAGGVRATHRVRPRGSAAGAVPSRRTAGRVTDQVLLYGASASRCSSRTGPSRSTTGAEQNNLLFTGHVLHEDTLTAQTTMQGSLMRFYEYMHYPGVDVLTEGNRSYWIVKQLSSAARQLGQQMAAVGAVRRHGLAARLRGPQGRRRLAGPVRHQRALSPPGLVHDGGRGEARLPGEHLLPVRLVAGLRGRWRPISPGWACCCSRAGPTATCS